MNEELILDADGVPILTERVHENETPATTGQQQDTVIATASASDIASMLLMSDSFRQQLEAVTVKLTESVRSQIELSLRPAIEQAIVLALEESDAHSTETVRLQLEAALPDLIARALEQ